MLNRIDNGVYSYHDDDVRLRLLLSDEMNDSHDPVGDHVRSVAVIIRAHQENDHLYTRAKTRENIQATIETLKMDIPVSMLCYMRLLF